MIALGLAAVVLVVNVVLALVWREDRRDRFDGVRSEIEQRLEQRRGGEDGAPFEGPGMGGRGAPGGHAEAPDGAERPRGPGAPPWSERHRADDDAEGARPGDGRTDGDGGAAEDGEAQGGSA
jgi:hypothetical protein